MSFNAWVVDTLIRAVKTFAQTAFAMAGVDQTTYLHADIKTILLTSAMAGVVSILHNIANLRVPEPVVGTVERT